MLYIIVAIIAVLCFILGFIFGRKTQKPVGMLILNKSMPHKPFFELHFTEDLDRIEKNNKVVFNRVVR